LHWATILRYVSSKIEAEQKKFLSLFCFKHQFIAEEKSETNILWKKMFVCFDEACRTRNLVALFFCFSGNFVLFLRNFFCVLLLSMKGEIIR